MFMVLIFLLLMVASVVVVGVWGVSLYNRLVFLRNHVKNAWAQIDVVLIRRYDLIPNLVEVAKTYMAHEKDTLEAVIQARNQAKQAEQSFKQSVDVMDAQAGQKFSQFQGAEMMLQQSLGRLMAVVEDYPELKANGLMQNLQQELTDTENRIAQMRQFYNQAVQDYETYRQSMPQALIANAMGFHGLDFLKAEPAQQVAPKIKF